MGVSDREHGSGGQKWFGFAARVTLTLVILVGLILILGDERLPDVIKEVSLLAFLISLILNIVASILLPALVSYVSAKPTDLSLGLGALVVINFAIRFYTLILPRAYATGIRWFKYRATGDGSSAVALVVLEKLVQVFTYALLTALFIALEWRVLGGAAPALLGVAGGLVVVSGIGLAVIVTDRADPVLAKLGFVTRIRWIGGVVTRIAEAVLLQRGRPPLQVMSLVMWSVVGYGFFVASAMVIARALGIEVSVAALAWIRGLVFLGTLIPITIAGAGFREVGFVGLLSIYDTDTTIALGFALALLGVQIAIGAIGALTELASFLIGRLGRQPDEPPRDSQDVEVLRHG